MPAKSGAPPHIALGTSDSIGMGSAAATMTQHGIHKMTAVVMSVLVLWVPELQAL